MDPNVRAARIAWPGPFLISVRPPSTGQKKLAAAVALGLLVMSGVALAFKNVKLARVDAFIPVADTIVCLDDVLTASLLYVQFSVTRNRALLALANGYLIAGLLVIPHQLTFPGAYSPTGLLGAQLQTTVWLSVLRNVLFLLAALIYTILNTRPTQASAESGKAAVPIAVSVSAIAAATVFMTWVTTAQGAHLPSLMADWSQGNAAFRNIVQPLRVVMAMLAILVFRKRPASVIDLWLEVALWSWFVMNILTSLSPPVRFGLVFYVGFTMNVMTSCFVLLSLLSESTMLHSRLVLSVAAREHERESRRTAMDVLMGSIAHELRQPLASIIINGRSGAKLAASTPTDIDEVRAIFSDIGSSATRASKILDSIRSMFTATQERGSIDMNELVQDAVGMMRMELETQNVAVRQDLASDLPPIQGHGGQLMQVLVNGLTNAIESLAAVVDRPRLIDIRTVRQSSDGVTITIEDTGAGLDPQMRLRAFEPFSTTKTHGMGLGLSICQSIVEAHGGALSLRPRSGNGAVFRVDLPAAFTARDAD